MPRPNQEYTARRFDSSHYDAGYECELPPEMRTELVGQRRRPIPPSVERSLPVKTTQPRGPLYFALSLCLIVLVGALYATWRQGQSAERARNKAISQPALAPQPTPAPTALHESSALSSRTLELRRAERVPVTVKRATLLRLTSQELGVYKWYDLPEVWGGGSVWARYMGTKGRFSEIPSNPVPGDLWNVTETGASWVYCMPAGYDHPVWIDP